MNNFYGFLTKKGKNIFLITLLSTALLFASCINDLFENDKSSKKQETQTEQTGSEELIPVKINISNKKQIENILQNVKPQKNISQARAASPQNVALKYKILYKKVTDTSQSSCELTDSSAVLKLSKGTWDFTLVAYYNDTSDKEMVVFSGDILNKEIIPGKNNSLEFTLGDAPGNGDLKITLKIPSLTGYTTEVKAQLKTLSLDSVDGYNETPVSIDSTENSYVYSLNGVKPGNYFAVFSITTKNLTAASDENSTETTTYPVPVRVVTNLSSESEETLDEIRNVCVITYALGTDGTVSWTADAKPVRVSKKYQNVDLPDYTSLNPLQTKIFNGWKDQKGTKVTSPMNITQNTTLTPDWITTTLYVDGSSTDTAVKTLQDAVNKLTDYEALDGNTSDYQHEWVINVKGTCYGASDLSSLEITKLTITGDKNAQVILDGRTSETGTATGAVITKAPQNEGTYPLFIEYLTIQKGSNTSGGGLNITNSTAYLNNVVLTGNTSSGNGGAIALKASKLFIYEGCQIGQKSSEAVAATDTACSNRAGKNGGGIYADANSTIYYGYTDADETNVTMTAETGTPSNIITYNYAGDPTEGSYCGGGIYCLGKLYTNGGTISYNSATHGGGISVSNETHLTGTTISGNKATTNGGGIYVESGNSAILFLSGKTTIGAASVTSFATSTSNSNSARNGGGIYIGASTATFLNYTSDGTIDESGIVNITYNYVETTYGNEGGGGIYADSGSELYIAPGTTINYNATNMNGGGIYGNGNTTYMSGGTIYGNNAKYGGGICLSGRDYKDYGSDYIDYGTLYMYGEAKIGTSENPNSALYGGGIYLADIYSKAYLGYRGINKENNNLQTETLTGGVSCNKAFFDTTYGGPGGGIYNKGLLQVSTGSISNNISDTDGGGVYNKGTFQFFSGKIESNEAGNDGGGVYNPSDKTFTMKGGTIESNTAVNGGGVYNKGIFNVSSGNIKSNTVTENGGGIYTTVETVLENSQITKNTAAYGGGIYISEDDLYIKKATTFNENTATNSGGAVYAYYTTIYIEDQGESAYAYIEPDSLYNDVYLDDSSKIISNATLSNTYYFARITPHSYNTTTKYIGPENNDSQTVPVSSYYNKFLVTPQKVTDTTGTITQVEWETTYEGKIQVKQP